MSAAMATADNTAPADSLSATDASSAPSVLKPWLRRERMARQDRKRFELSWDLCQAFIQGRQWVGWDTINQRVIELPNPQDRARHTVNVLTQYLWTQQGKLTVDDLRPDITFFRDDMEGQSFAKHAKVAFDWGWSEEFEAEDAYMSASLKRLTYGMGGLRCHYDPLWGPQTAEIPFVNGQPVTDGATAHETVSQAILNREVVEMRKLREGRIVWEPFGPYNTLPPPGVDHESHFPWLILERPMELSIARAVFGQKAAKLHEEKIRAADTITAQSLSGGDWNPTPRGDQLMKDHVMIKTGYLLPNDEFPQGQTVVWAQQTELATSENLPYTINGQPKIGVVFLKYHVIDRRFWPIGLIEPGIGPQRQRNIARSQMIEIKDRLGLARVFSHESAFAGTKTPIGLPVELILVKDGYEFPKEMQGIGPGPWLKDEADISDADMRQVMGSGDISLSQVPSGVSAYSAFALLVEQDDRRIGPIRKLDRVRIAELTKFTINGMRRYWPPQKNIPLENPEDGLMDYLVFRASQLPESVFVKIPTSAPLPDSQAAMAQLITDIFDRSISSGQPLPLTWLYNSFIQGRIQPLPDNAVADQERIAQQENMLMAHGNQIAVSPLDNDQIHIVQHEGAIQAYQLLAGSGSPDFQQQFTPVAQILMQHLQAHIQQAAQKSANGQQLQGTVGQAPGLQTGAGPMQAAMGSRAAIGVQGGGPAQTLPDIRLARAANSLSARGVDFSSIGVKG